MLEKLNNIIEEMEEQQSLMAVEPGERERLQELYEELLDMREVLLAGKAC